MCEAEVITWSANEQWVDRGKLVLQFYMYMSFNVDSIETSAKCQLIALYPIGSMYAIYIYGNIYHQYTPNVSIYTIHGSYGYSTHMSSPRSVFLPRNCTPRRGPSIWRTGHLPSWRATSGWCQRKRCQTMSCWWVASLVSALAKMRREFS